MVRQSRWLHLFAHCHSTSFAGTVAHGFVHMHDCLKARSNGSTQLPQWSRVNPHWQTQLPLLLLLLEDVLHEFEERHCLQCLVTRNSFGWEHGSFFLAQHFFRQSTAFTHWPHRFLKYPSMQSQTFNAQSPGWLPFDLKKISLSSERSTFSQTFASVGSKQPFTFSFAPGQVSGLEKVHWWRHWSAVTHSLHSFR